MITDPIADFLTHIRNACTARHKIVETPASKEKERMLKVLVDEGYVQSYEQSTNANDKPMFKINLNYTPNGEPVLNELTRISRPGRRSYVGKDDVPSYKGGLGVVLISTSQGVMSDSEARKKGIGGEVLCSVF